MKSDFEYVNYSDSDRDTMLETRAAEIRRMLGSVGPEPAAFEVPSGPFGAPEGGPATGAGGPGPDDRTEALISGGRRNSGPRRLAFFRDHWRTTSVVAVVLVVLVIIVAATAGGGRSETWPASVTQMQAQITTACQNPNVAAEPSQVNFACAKGTRQVLWVFALLTSGGNPGYVDPVTGRKGLEPITPAQGGDVAWSLNLHQPYNPANPVDSLEVARAINNIIGGATLTDSTGQPSVQAGLESTAANCQRYSGSQQVTSKAGYPALCTRPVTASGAEALVGDVFRQWMTGAPTQTAADAGVLFANAGDPSSPQVQKILNSLPGSGL